MQCRPDRARPSGAAHARRDATLRNVAQGPRTTEPRRRGSRRRSRPGREHGRGWQGQCARCWTLMGGPIGNSRACSARGEKRWWPTGGAASGFRRRGWHWRSRRSTRGDVVNEPLTPEALRDRMAEQRWGPAGLAAALGVARAAITRWQSGRSSPAAGVTLALAEAERPTPLDARHISGPAVRPADR